MVDRNGRARPPATPEVGHGRELGRYEPGGWFWIGVAVVAFAFAGGFHALVRGIGWP